MLTLAADAISAAKEAAITSQAMALQRSINALLNTKYIALSSILNL
jgi:hypothetical protein